MSAELLRRAATILRERAEAATPGLWAQFPSGAVASDSYGAEYLSVSKGSTPDTAAYIATMHPGVGLALADWLDEVAYGVSPTRTDYPHALTVARLIVGESND